METKKSGASVAFSNFSRFSRSGASAIQALQPRNQAILTQPILPRESLSPNQNARYGDSPEIGNMQSLQFWDKPLLAKSGVQHPDDA